MRKIAKIILFLDDAILFAVKRAPSESLKDGKMELPGGGVDKRETPLQGLVRELAEEEESGVVAAKAAGLRLQPIELTVEGDRHFIYHMPLARQELEKIRMKSEETYGYKLASRANILDLSYMNDELVFTRRTVKIFRKLRRLNHFPYDRD
jgi:ADP-ribose pyrophosphatase YjhB (NUDIX family)